MDKRDMIDGSIKPFISETGIIWCSLHYTKNVSENKPCKECLKLKGKK